MTDKKEGKLFPHSKETYGTSFQAELFEQYKLYVASAERISERRESANNYLLTVNASLVTLFGVLSTSGHKGDGAIFVSVAGVLVSLTWHRIITSYRDLNTVKFRVIHELEEHMPAALYKYEWHKAEKGRGSAYQPLSHLEALVPFVFVALYLVLGIIGVLGMKA